MVKWKESTVLFGTMYICTCKYLFLCSLKHFKVTFIGKKMSIHKFIFCQSGKKCIRSDTSTVYISYL